MRTAEVKLNGETHVVEELRSRANRKWRGELEEHFTELATVLESAPDIELSDGEALGRILRAVGGKLLGSVDIVVALVTSYAPKLPIDEAYDSEVLDAFGKVLGLAYPFGGMLDQVLMRIGSLRGQIEPS